MLGRKLWNSSFSSSSGYGGALSFLYMRPFIPRLFLVCRLRNSLRPWTCSTQVEYWEALLRGNSSSHEREGA